MYNILVCDDEPDIVSALKIYLSSAGYNIITASNGEEALDAVKANDIHLVLMDIMMPKLDGITALSRLRESENIPVILLTAKSEDTDKVLGLDIGADDYVTKPFNPVELIARVKSQLRRYMQLGGSKTEQDEIKIGRIELYDKSKTVLADGEQVMLTPTEYAILKILMQNPNAVYSPKELYRLVWNESSASFGSEGAIAVHIRHLREKIEINPAEPRYIKVVWGQGYMIKSD